MKQRNFEESDNTGSEDRHVEIKLRPELLERHSADRPFNDALNEAQAKLAVASEIFQNHGDGGRLGVYYSMIDIIGFFESQGIPHAALAPVSAVVEAIIDAERGRDSPIFKKATKPRGGKAPTAANKLIFDGHIAAVAYCCVLHCQNKKKWPFRDEAARLASDLIKDSSWPVAPKPLQLINLLERISQVEASRLDRSVFDELMKAAMAQQRPLEYAKALLASPLVDMPPKDNFLSNPPLSQE